MDTSYLLARILGIAIIVIYSGVLINKDKYLTFWKTLSEQPVTFFITGFLALVLGLILTQIHNVWTFDWRVLITLLGWLMLISGVLRIVFPQVVLNFANKLMGKGEKTVTVAASIMLLLGVFLTYVGYFHI